MPLIRANLRHGRTGRLRGAVLACALLVMLRAVSASTAVWIDTDPSIGSPIREVDDGFALVLAFHSPELRIKGISSTYGNTRVGATTRIARELVERFGGTPIAVHAGAHSHANLGTPTTATEGLRAALQKQRLTYLALGPLTNLATFCRLHPELTPRIDRVVIVGGQLPNVPLVLGPNGFPRIKDANVFKDPAAVAAVLRSDIPITLAPVSTSSQLRLNDAELKSIRSSEAGRFLYQHSRVWSWFFRDVVRTDGGPLFDALAVLVVARPNAVRVKRRYASISNTNDLILREDRTPGSRAVESCIALQPNARELVRRRLAEAPR